ncbi:kinase-like protein [Amylocystis lapponica]|nr:kinase-like protein [Amylocystis lapponica]
MSASWFKRKARLDALLDVNGDEDDAEALALDRILHGQSVIGKTSKTAEIDALRFTDKDLDVVGTLEYGQFGVIDVVTCKLNGCVYVRKSIEKRLALKTFDQCSPQLERDILLRARRSDSEWAPHLLCAFQSPTHLNLVMDYAEGGTLWDVLESSPHDGKVPEVDLHWWLPQIVSAIHWCHSQGFVHRDVKPHNFVLMPSSRLQLIDFGSAAPLFPPEPDGSQQVPKQHCLVPCGTCDYISPEILQAHEEALVALEMDDASSRPTNDTGGYGRETDWWSMGAMLYEMAYGVAPFFANDIKQTYVKITEHYKYLRYNKSISISNDLQDLLRRLLTSSELRLGRGSIKEIMDHPFFSDINWSTLRDRPRPDKLHLPQFTYSTPVAPTHVAIDNSHSPSEASYSRPFAFSALFQSSPLSNPGTSILPTTPAQNTSRSILREHSLASFIGFSWGPPKDVFGSASTQPNSEALGDLNTPRPLRGSPIPNMQRYPFATPIRPSALTPHQTLPRASTLRRTAPRRAVSDREAMKQLAECVGMSARKKVLESGRKPRVLASFSRSSGLKELRFDTSVVVVGGDGGMSYKADPPTYSSESVLGASLLSVSGASAATQELLVENASFSDADSDAPPSPSPTPRPGSAMSMLSRRSQTPTTSSSYFLRVGQGGVPGDEARRPVSPSFAESTSLAPAAEGRPHDLLDGDLSYAVLDKFERRHARLLQDIASTEDRLVHVMAMVRDPK